MKKQVLRDFETRLIDTAEKKIRDILNHLESWELLQDISGFFPRPTGCIITNLWTVGDSICFIIKENSPDSGFVYHLYMIRQNHGKMEVRRLLIGRWVTNCTQKGENRLIKLGCDLYFDDLYGMDAGSRVIK